VILSQAAGTRRSSSLSSLQVRLDISRADPGSNEHRFFFFFSLRLQIHRTDAHYSFVIFFPYFSLSFFFFFFSPSALTFSGMVLAVLLQS
jgi:hypothetical protein